MIDTFLMCSCQCVDRLFACVILSAIGFDVPSRTTHTPAIVECVSTPPDLRDATQVVTLTHRPTDICETAYEPLTRETRTVLFTVGSSAGTAP